MNKKQADFKQKLKFERRDQHEWISCFYKFSLSINHSSGTSWGHRNCVFKEVPIFCPTEPENIATKPQQLLGSEEGILDRRELMRGNPKLFIYLFI